MLIMIILKLKQSFASVHPALTRRNLAFEWKFMASFLFLPIFDANFGYTTDAWK
jgi:hypothetical protein